MWLLLPLLHIWLCKLIIPLGRGRETPALIPAFQRSSVCPTEWAELHGSSLTCFAWHSHRVQLFLSSHSLTPDLTQAGTQLYYPSSRKVEWVDCVLQPWGNSFLHHTHTHTHKTRQGKVVCVCVCVCHLQPHKTTGLGPANGVYGESLELQ